MTPEQRSLRARMAANTRWSREDPYDPTGSLPRARKAFEDRFARQVDPNGTLPLDERQRRADAARRAYFQRLALLSARARTVRRSR